MKGRPEGESRFGASFRGTLATSALVVAIGIGALGMATDGYQAFTPEAARALAVQQRPAALPAVQLTDQSGRHFDLREELGPDGIGRPVWIVGFIYTRCISLCSALTAQYRQLQQEIVATGWQGRIRLLLVSFDPDRDTPAVLLDHARRYGLAGSDALLAVPDSTRDLQATLAAFGVRVLPLADGEYAHNAAFHIVTPGPRLSGIVPIDEPARALDLAVALARAHEGA
jgi:protein SCO1/2